MAQTATVKRAPQTAETAPRIGRPPGARNKIPADKKAKVFDYSRYKNTFQKPADFYIYLDGYPEKTGLCAYLFRLKPRIDLSLIGITDTHIHQTSNEIEMTEDFAGDTFGRGLYMLNLNDANRGKGQTLVATTWFDCALALKPPQYDPRTLCLGEAKNQDEITRLINQGVLVRDRLTGGPRLRNETDGEPPPAVTAAAAPAGGGSDLFGRDVLGQVLLGLINRGSANPHDTVKDTIEIARLLHPPAPAFNVDDLVERVAARLGGVPGGAAGRPVDLFANYERVEQFVQKVRGPIGTGVAAVAGDNAGALVANWAPHVPGILMEARALIPEIVSAFRQLRAEGAAQNGAVPMTMDQRIEQVAVSGFKAMQQGVSGFDFAAYVCTHMAGGLEVYQALEPIGAVGLLGLAAMRPATRGIVTNAALRPQLENFLESFFSFDPDGSGSEELPPGSAAPAA